MGGKEPVAVTLSDLIRRARPVTASSSLLPSRQVSTSEHRKNSHRNGSFESSGSTCQSPKPKTLKPLNHPAYLVGTLALPPHPGRSSSVVCSCFQFSDDSSTVCCDMLDFNPRMIGKKIRVVAWNFIPFKCRDGGVICGVLEIIRWEFFHVCGESVCSLSDLGFLCFSLGACRFSDSSKASCLIFGVIESVSPVFVVPCGSSKGSGSKNIKGFVVNVLVCQCKSCSSRFLASAMRSLDEKSVKDHNFDKIVALYFIELASSWHPVILRFIDKIVVVAGLKKKLVSYRKGKSQLMYVTTEDMSLHIAMLPMARVLNNSGGIRGKGECGSYIGVITGVYMQGMVVELDQDALLLLTSQDFTVPHSVRVGGLVRLKNVHFVDPKFTWGKMLILGACYRTSIHVQSFSPLETGCHLKAHSQSLLQKFIDSLPFAARLWTLLVISCFRKKFSEFLSEKEILGSKHVEGLAQKYARLHLPLSAFQCQHGIMEEFCKHETCYGVEGAHYRYLRLVVPISNLITYCETSWKDSEDGEKFSTFEGDINIKKPLSCGGRSYLQPSRRILHTSDIGILLLGTMRISSSSGRLQLVDATGGLDIMFDVPATWDFDRIFEARDLALILEGIPPKLVDLDSSLYHPFSCQSIFSNSLQQRHMKSSIYLQHNRTDKDSSIHSLFFDWRGNCKEFDGGRYHLLMLTHKFPIQPKFLGGLAKIPNMFAQAVVLPWDLVVAKKCEAAIMSLVSSGHWMDALENSEGSDELFSCKRHKPERGCVKASNHGLKNAGNGLDGYMSGSAMGYCNNSAYVSCVLEQMLVLPCLISAKGVDRCWLGNLNCPSDHAQIRSSSKLPGQKVLLEFGRDSFCIYEVLKIGQCYLLRHRDKDVLCCIRENYQVSHAKVSVCSESHLWSLTLSSIESLQSSDVSDILPDCTSHTSSDEVSSKECQQHDISGLTNNDVDGAAYSEIEVCVPSSSLNLLKEIITVVYSNCIVPGDSFKDELHIPDLSSSTTDVPVQSSGSLCSDYPLPKGNLITLHGLVVAYHDTNGDTFPAHLSSMPAECYLPMFLRGNGVCIHVLVDNQTIRIFCDLSKHNYPVGFGRDVYATFHRILALSEKNNYMMMPVSFITINNTNLVHGHLSGEFNFPSESVGLAQPVSPTAAPMSLIYNALQSSELKPMQLRCRVVGIYMIMLEKTRASSVYKPSVGSIPSVGIPLAGFIMDDGSSSCCCWANSERAAALLQLESADSLPNIHAETLLGTCNAHTALPFSSTAGCLDQILEHHGKIVVKNCGSLFDALCQELVFLVNSDRLMSSSEEAVVRSMVTTATLATSWSISGSIMDPERSAWVEEKVGEVGMALPPVVNVWAASVGHVDMLAEARNIIQQLRS